jgi:myo-inositol-1(or 4)-monophosphatase
LSNTRLLLETAQRAADEAAGFLREQEGRMTPDRWTSKGTADFVTEVDREAERLIAHTLTGTFPDSVVMGEELSPDSVLGHRSSVVWIVDPLDGTTNFLHRYPEYAVSIGCSVNGELVAGCVIHVPMDVRFSASKGGGAWMDEHRMHVSAITDPGHALIGTGFPFRDIAQLDLYQRQFAAVTKATAGIRRAGSAALDLCDVAAGRFEGFWELRLSPWDVAAGVLMITEAGGVVTHLEGEKHDALQPGSILAGNPAMHTWLLRTLAAVR